MSYRCAECGVRWAQWGGLCRRCWRSSGQPVETTREREAGRIARRTAREDRVGHVLPALEGPRREVLIDGVLYEIIWDGT